MHCNSSGSRECQVSGSSTATQSISGEQKSRNDVGGLASAKNGRRSPENLQQQQQQQRAGIQPEAVLSARITAPRKPDARAVVVGSHESKHGSTSGLVDAEWARNGLEREVGMAGARLLQVTKSDLSRAPFHASPEVTRKFLRSLRTLRLHAFAAAAIRWCGAAWKQHGSTNDAKRYACQNPFSFSDRMATRQFTSGHVPRAQTPRTHRDDELHVSFALCSYDVE